MNLVTPLNKATVGQKNGQTDKSQASLEESKKSKHRLENNTHKNRVTNRVKMTWSQICELECPAARDR